MNGTTIIEALPGGGGGGPVALFPKNRKFVFLCSLFPKIVSVPLKIWPLFPCSPEINTIFPLFPQTPGRVS